MSAIQTDILRKTFPGGIEAVAGIDIQVREGEIYGFLGPNGAGKSTTTRMLTTLLRPSAGSARVGGLDIVEQSHQVRQIIGVALQEAGLDAYATGRELLELQARLHGLHGSHPRERAAELLDLVGLSEAADRRVQTYSGGMKRRLDLASALVHDPIILFLDEPTTGLDPASRATVWEEIRRLNTERGITVFLTTQYLEEADRLADRVGIIDHGRIVAEGTPAELKASVGSDVLSVTVPARQRAKARRALEALKGMREIQDADDGLTVFVRNGRGAVAAAVRMLDDAKVRVDSVTVTEPSLDEVFLRATGSRLEGAHIEVEETPA